jgi:predicted Zn-dependent protease
MKTKFEKIADFMAKNVTADDWQLNIHAGSSHETRFAGDNIMINLSVAFGNKTGRCSINQTDEAALAGLVKSAEEMAIINQPDPEYIVSAGAAEYPKVDNVSAATANLKAEEMVEVIRTAIASAEKQGATVSGMTEKHHPCNYTATKNGFRGYSEYTEFGHSMTLKKDHVETKVSFSNKDYQCFDIQQELDRLNHQLSSLTTPQSFEPERIPVILRPGALMEFFYFMLWMMNRRQADEGLTAFSDQLGKQFLGEKFNMSSTLKIPELITEAYSRDCIVSGEIDWVTGGVLQNLPTPRYWAMLNNLTPSSVFNLYVPGGNASEEDMMKLVPRGLIVNRFWYIRTVDMKSGELTGMTRDGVWYFEDGKVKHAVNNLRFNEIPHDTTRRILALGKSEITESSVMLPTMLIDGFNFVDKTSF